MSDLKKQTSMDESFERRGTDSREPGATSQAVRGAKPGKKPHAKTPGPISPTLRSWLWRFRRAVTHSGEAVDSKTPGPIWPTWKAMFSRSD